MSDIIPVIVHHETGEKPQTGGKKNQEYLRYCIAQAKKYNEKVVLLGDQYNKDWCDDWHDANDFITDKWKEFHSVFKNLSPYPQAWAEGIFRRFFLILEYLDRYGYDNCVIMDSDILLYTNVSTYEPFRHCKMAAESPLEQDIAVLWKGNGYKWKVCAGVAYFTRQGLIEFTDYCIDMYKNHMDVLMEKWNIHQKYQIYGGVAEMSLLYLWVKTLPDGEFLNLLMDDADHCVFDNSIGLPDGYLEGQYEFNRRLGVKKLHWEDGKPYCYTLDGHQKTGLLCLHFVGVTKIFMEGIYEHQDYARQYRTQGRKHRAGDPSDGIANISGHVDAYRPRCALAHGEHVKHLRAGVPGRFFPQIVQERQGSHASAYAEHADLQELPEEV